MNTFDHWLKQELGIQYYGRYVDDFVLIHRDKEFLKSCIPVIRTYLKKEIKLELHPHKIHLQHYSKGVQYLGAVIKPHRIYVARRTTGNFYASIAKHNRIVRDNKPEKETQKAFLSSMNSYLGIMKHYKTYKLRKLMIFNVLSAEWWKFVYLEAGIQKFVLKKKYSVVDCFK